MRKPSISELVLRKVHRTQKPNDSTTFLQLIQRCLVPEVREEVQRYFGKIDCLEAQYPGLDYTYAPHRRRLAAFQWHRRLFRAFDELRLTDDEILGLCAWEGTRAAKERYERESQTTIEITTLHGICQSDAGGSPRGVFHYHTCNDGSSSSSQDNSSSQTSYPATARKTTSRGKKKGHSLAPGAAAAKGREEVGEALDEDVSEDEEDEGGEGEEEEEEEEDDDDYLARSVGLYLNQRLIAAADARERGEDVRFDQQWEQWMKEALERDMDLPTILETIRSVSGRPQSSSSAADAHASSSAYPGPEARAASGSSGSADNTSLQAPASRLPGSDVGVHTRTVVSSTTVPAPEPQSYDQLHDMLDELQNSGPGVGSDGAALPAVHADVGSETTHEREPATPSANHARLSSLVEELQTNTTRLEAENTAMANFLSRSRAETAR